MVIARITNWHGNVISNHSQIIVFTLSVHRGVGGGSMMSLPVWSHRGSASTGGGGRGICHGGGVLVLPFWHIWPSGTDLLA